MTDIIDLRAPDMPAKAREDYKRLVLKAFDDLEHAARREFLDHKADIQIKSRERL